jgi:hypothetical protein
MIIEFTVSIIFSSKNNYKTKFLIPKLQNGNNKNTESKLRSCNTMEQ